MTNDDNAHKTTFDDIMGSFSLLDLSEESWRARSAAPVDESDESGRRAGTQPGSSAECGPQD
jgi:hypothetical protein